MMKYSITGELVGPFLCKFTCVSFRSHAFSAFSVI